MSERWVMYAIEGSLLGCFMVVACATVIAVQHPASAIRRRVGSAAARRALIGIVMGGVAVALITSELGQRSGAHMNPAVTVTYWLLGRVPGSDVAGYIAGQFAGAVSGLGLVRLVMRRQAGDASVRWVVTQPGRPGTAGVLAAFAAEVAIALVLFLVVLVLSNHAGLARWTPWAVGALVAVYITFEAPISGMSLNPARTIGSALFAGSWRGLWVYCTAPLLGMVLAGLVYTSVQGRSGVYCAKLDHSGSHACHFHCRVHEMPGRRVQPAVTERIEDGRVTGAILPRN